MPDLTPDHPAVQAADAALRAWMADLSDALPDDMMVYVLSAALPPLPDDGPEAPAGPGAPPPVLRSPSRVGARVHLYPRGYEIDPDAYGLFSVGPATHSAAVLIVTSPDPRTGQPTTVARCLSTHHARQLGSALILAADYADPTDHEETRP